MSRVKQHLLAPLNKDAMPGRFRAAEKLADSLRAIGGLIIGLFIWGGWITDSLVSESTAVMGVILGVVMITVGITLDVRLVRLGGNKEGEL